MWKFVGIVVIVCTVYTAWFSSGTIVTAPPLLLPSILVLPLAYSILHYRIFDSLNQSLTGETGNVPRNAAVKNFRIISILGEKRHVFFVIPSCISLYMDGEALSIMSSSTASLYSVEYICIMTLLLVYFLYLHLSGFALSPRSPTSCYRVAHVYLFYITPILELMLQLVIATRFTMRGTPNEW
jgi:hypothetical protein